MSPLVLTESSRRRHGTDESRFTSLGPYAACPTCGQAMGEHTRCGACSVLTGPGHTQATDGLCGGCWRQSQMPEGAEQVKLAIGRNRVA